MADALGAVGSFLLMQLIYFVIFCAGCYIAFHAMGKWQMALEGTLLARLLRSVEAAYTGDDISLFTNDADNAMNAAGFQVGHLLMALFPLIGGSIMIIAVDIRLWLFCIVGGLFFMCADIFFAKPVKDIGEQVQADTANANGKLTDIVTGAQTVKLFGLSDQKIKEYAKPLERIRTQGMRRIRIICVQTGLNNWRHFIIEAGILGVGCLFVARGEYQLSDLMMLQPMLGQMLYKLTLIVYAFVWMQPGIASAMRIEHALDRPQEDMRLEGRLIAPAGDVALELKDVVFHYPDREERALDGINIKVGRGEVVALVGASGSGKTTIFRLLMGMLAPDSGTVRQWGIDCQAASLASWRSNMAYVAQEATLFDATLGENIAFGRLGAAADSIRTAAQNADAGEFIAALPGGMDTPAGLLGGRISGGQRQRVAIARAFLRDAPVLLLDEATSSLDAESEVEVQKTIDNLLDGRSVLVCAHRLSTIVNADKIIVLDKGRIVETGRHDELLAARGAYYELWKKR